MEDQEIIRLYWDRSPSALAATAEKYGSYCTAIARNILGSAEDAEECVNDAYLNVWNAIPPQRPAHLAAFLGKVTRNLAFDRYRHDRAERRGGGEAGLVLDELAECIPGAEDTERAFEQKETLRAVGRFLEGLPRSQRELFVRRYWYAEAVSVIAARYRRPAGSVAVSLRRLRAKLKAYLLEGGYEV